MNEFILISTSLQFYFVSTFFSNFFLFLSSGLGSCLALTGRLEESLVVLDQLRSYRPRDVDGLSRRADVLKAMSRKEDAREMHEEILSYGHDTVLLRTHLGDYAFEDKSYTTAFKEYSIALNMSKLIKMKNPDDFSHYVTVMHRIGKCYKEFGESLKSVKYLEKALLMSPSGKEIMMDLAAVLMERGRV